jgi:hypothetical protein
MHTVIYHVSALEARKTHNMYQEMTAKLLHSCERTHEALRTSDNMKVSYCVTSAHAGVTVQCRLRRCLAITTGLLLEHGCFAEHPLIIRM